MMYIEYRNNLLIMILGRIKRQHWQLIIILIMKNKNKS
ncbi:MAG: hypothetical protein ACI8RD_005340 [Bacillariaceae sp.]|jgi:hypothetical protein